MFLKYTILHHRGNMFTLLTSYIQFIEQILQCRSFIKIKGISGLELVTSHFLDIEERLFNIVRERIVG